MLVPVVVLLIYYYYYYYYYCCYYERVILLKNSQHSFPFLLSLSLVTHFTLVTIKNARSKTGKPL